MKEFSTKEKKEEFETFCKELEAKYAGFWQRGTLDNVEGAWAVTDGSFFF